MVVLAVTLQPSITRAQAVSNAPPPWLQKLTTAQPRAIDQVLTSSRSDNPFLRANAIEAAHSLRETGQVVPLAQLGLDDAHEAVRFAAAVTIGKLKLTKMAPAVSRLRADPSDSVQAAALFALYRCGQDVDISPIAAMLASPQPATRGNVAMLLGEMGEHDAKLMLEDLARTPMPRAGAVQEALVRVQIAEAIVKLGDDSTLNAIRAGMYSPFDEVRVLSITMLGRLGDQRMEAAVAQLLAQPPIELQVAAADCLSRLGRPDGLPVVLHASESEIPTVRAQAAIALGGFPGAKTAAALLSLLDDPEEQVRLSAAAAILRLNTKAHR